MGIFIISNLKTISSKSAPSGKSWGGGSAPFSTTRPTDDISLLAAINSTVQENPSLYAGWKTGDVNVTGTWTIRFIMLLNDAIISLDGNPPISFVSLPSGATPLTATLQVSVAQPTSLNGDQSGTLYLQRSSLVQSDNLSQRLSHTPVIKSFSYSGNLTFLDILADGCGIVCEFVTAGTISQEFFNLQITGTYAIQSNSQIEPSITSPLTGVVVGDKIKITSPIGGLDGVEQVILNYEDHEIILNIDSQDPYMSIDGEIYNWLNFIILQQAYQFWFYLPYGFGTFSGPVLVTLVGNGQQFSGSVTAGVLEVLFSDASGIYTLVKSQTNDIIYTRDGITTINKLIMLNLSEDDEIVDDSFFKLLGYPRAILAMSNLDEDDIETEDFYRIATAQDVVIPVSVEIPSPYIKTAFLP